MSGFQVRRLGRIMEPERGNPCELEGVLNPAAVRGPEAPVVHEGDHTGGSDDQPIAWVDERRGRLLSGASGPGEIHGWPISG